MTKLESTLTREIRHAKMDRQESDKLTEMQRKLDDVKVSDYDPDNRWGNLTYSDAGSKI